MWTAARGGGVATRGRNRGGNFKNEPHSRLRTGRERDSGEKKIFNNYAFQINGKEQIVTTNTKEDVGTEITLFKTHTLHIYDGMHRFPFR